jgi:hypothetical protein
VRSKEALKTLEAEVWAITVRVAGGHHPSAEISRKVE